MKIPKKVKVGAITYKVKQVDKVNRLDEVGYITTGLWEPLESVIYIDKNLEEQQKLHGFIHELIHAIFDHCGIEQDENKVDLIATALHMIIVDNPEIFEN